MGYQLYNERKPVRKVKKDHPVIEAIVAVTGAAVVIGALILAVSFLAGWFLMLGIGVLHGSWWATVPTMPYWTAVLVDLTLGTWIAMQAAFSSKHKD